MLRVGFCLITVLMCLNVFGDDAKPAAQSAPVTPPQSTPVRPPLGGPRAGGDPTRKNCSACRTITAACQKAGFSFGKAKTGEGLWVDCMSPIMSGKPSKSKKPVPKIDKNVLNACHACNPSFALSSGGGRNGTGGRLIPPRPVKPAAQTAPAAPVAPAPPPTPGQ